MKLDWMDVTELAAIVLGLDPDDFDPDVVEQGLYDKFDCSIEQFHEIVEALIPFTIPAASPLTKTLYQGFVLGNRFVVKAKA